jgi:hypothetical protein
MVLYLVTIVLVADLLLVKDRPEQAATKEFERFSKWLVIELTVFLANIGGMALYTLLAYLKTSYITL